MMKIHKAQRDAFEAQAAETFPARVRTLLHDRLPERRAELAGEEGLERVRAVITRAHAYGFTGERDACKFAALSYLLGHGFEDAPWAKGVLADPARRTPTERIEALWDRAEERELDEGANDTLEALS